MQSFEDTNVKVPTAIAWMGRDWEKSYICDGLLAL